MQAHYALQDPLWNGRVADLNARLARLGAPVQLANMGSVWTTLYTRPGRYHWMFQYYLRAAGLALGWIGTGRLIFSHALTGAEYQAIAERFVGAAEAMLADGWWWHDAALTRRSIEGRMLGETLSAWRGRSGGEAWGRGARPGAAAAALRGRA